MKKEFFHKGALRARFDIASGPCLGCGKDLATEHGFIFSNGRPLSFAGGPAMCLPCAQALGGIATLTAAVLAQEAKTTEVEPIAGHRCDVCRTERAKYGCTACSKRLCEACSARSGECLGIIMAGGQPLIVTMPGLHAWVPLDQFQPIHRYEDHSITLTYVVGASTVERTYTTTVRLRSDQPATVIFDTAVERLGELEPDGRVLHEG